MDEYKLQLVRDALKTLYRYKADPNGFMKQLVANQFYLQGLVSIWDHFAVLTSLSPTFDTRYRKTVLLNYRVPNRKFWSDYLGKIEGFLYYMVQLPGEQSVILDRALNQFAASAGLTPEQQAYLQQMRGTPVQQRMDMIDQFLKKKSQPVDKYAGIPLPKEEKEEKEEKPAETTEPETSQPVGKPEDQQKLQNTETEKNEREVLTTPSGTLSPGEKILTDAEAERISQTGPIRQPSTIIIPERSVLVGPTGEPIKEGLVAYSSDENEEPKPKTGSENTPGRHILTNEAENVLHQGRMGLIHGAPAVENAAKNFGGEVIREITDIPFLGGPPRENVVYWTPQQTTSMSTGGGRFSPPHSVRTTTNVLKSVRRAKKAATTEAAAEKLAERVGFQLATKNPWVLAIVGVTILVAIILLWFVSDIFHDVQNTAYCGLPDTPCGRAPSQTVETTNTVAIYKNGPDHVNQGDQITYNISVTYTGPGVADLQITDAIPAGTTFVSYFPNDPATSTNVNGTITWTTHGTPSNTPQVFYITVTAPSADVWVQNTATVRALGTSIAPGANTPPNQSNCNGEWGPTSYFGRFPQNGNFGDPNCDFTRDALIALLRIDDPINADYWFNTIVRCESGYDPNAYAAVSTSGSAWGLYQMNASGHSTTGPDDVGNVIWQQQTANATNTLRYLIAHGLSYNGVVGFPAYWQAARPGQCN